MKPITFRRGAGRTFAASLFLLAVAALSPTPARADGPAAAPPATPPATAPITVTAKLVEIPGKFPDDELYDYAYVMRYQVIGGPMDKQSILVAHYKPRQPRPAIKDKMKSVVSGKVRAFHVGDVQKLQLTSNIKSVWKGPVVDEFGATDHKSTRYFALVADPG
ncbi:MAG: hypothetical protein ACJ8F1_08280 [Polyangia bacterium]